LPKLKNSTHHYVTQGLGYVYMDSKTKQFTMSEQPIKSNMSAVGQTLQQIYLTRGLGYIMYNDEDPAGNQELLYTRFNDIKGKPKRKPLKFKREA
jgi:hypothetical protein